MNLLTSIVLFLMLALGACQSSHDLAVARGPLFALNPGRWQPTEQDLALTDSKRGALPAAAPVVDRPAALAVGQNRTPVTLSAAGPQQIQQLPQEMLR